MRDTDAVRDVEALLSDSDLDRNEAKRTSEGKTQKKKWLASMGAQDYDDLKRWSKEAGRTMVAYQSTIIGWVRLIRQVAAAEGVSPDVIFYDMLEREKRALKRKRR